MQKRLTPEKREAQLLKGGAMLAESFGYLDITHQQIAQQCDVSTATAFVYFKTVDVMRYKLALEITAHQSSFPKAAIEVQLMIERGLLNLSQGEDMR